ncbi:MAG: hypothetical protein LIR50_10225 [Bacillota bacterium]|nr:hypothetical protein [Bacillota bacterium]
MKRTITINKEIDIDLFSISDAILNHINNYFKDRYDVNDPETEIVDYESIIIDVLEFTLDGFR